MCDVDSAIFTIEFAFVLNEFFWSALANLRLPLRLTLLIWGNIVIADTVVYVVNVAIIRGIGRWEIVNYMPWERRRWYPIHLLLHRCVWRLISRMFRGHLLIKHIKIKITFLPLSNHLFSVIYLLSEIYQTKKGKIFDQIRFIWFDCMFNLFEM